MVDIAKVADIVLLMIDGNYGFEMETMEFLNILAATGMPGNVFGILTHLDLFRKPQALKEAKKRLKHRLWTELYQGAHLFYLSGVLNGRYPDREIHNLSRFLSVMKNPRPLVWRNSHPYTIIDNYRDITHPTKIEEDETCDRSIELSGYLRGTNFAAQGQRVHIAGLGDFTISSMEVLPDPCPTPAMEQALAKITGKTGRRRLDEKDKKLWAPMADRSGMKITGDHIVITREKGFAFDKDAEGVERGEGEQLIVDLQGERRLLGYTDKGVKLFASGEQIDRVPEEADSGRKTQRSARFLDGGNSDDEEMLDHDGSVSGDDEEGSDVEEAEFDEGKLGKMFRKSADKDQGDDLAFADSDSDLGSLSGDEDLDDDEDEDEELDSDEEGAAVRWKDNMMERAKALHGKRRPYRAVDLARFMYDTTISPKEALEKWRGEDEEVEEDIEEDDEAFFRRTGRDERDDLFEDRSIPRFDYEQLAAKWSSGDAVEALRSKFATANLLDDEGGDDDGDEDDMDGFGGEDEDDEGDGAFEDLETGETHGGDEDEDEDEDEDKSEEEPADNLEAEREKNARRKEELKLRFEEEDREGFKNDKAVARREGGDQEFGEDDWYEAQKAVLQKQLDINKAEFEELDESQRTAVEGFRAGKYAKVVIEGIPAEFVNKFQARLPIIVGGLSATEDRFGFVQVRIKRHRWHKKIRRFTPSRWVETKTNQLAVKTGDPLIFSLGWRRFQSLPIYSISDSRTRNRMLKYTPEHMHCFGTFYGPLIAPNTGFACFQSFSSSNPGFRIAATGTVLSVDESTEIVKKLKLVSPLHCHVVGTQLTHLRPARPTKSSKTPPSSKTCSTPPSRSPSSRAPPSKPSRASAARSSARWPSPTATSARRSRTRSSSATSSSCAPGTPSSRTASITRPPTSSGGTACAPLARSAAPRTSPPRSTRTASTARSTGRRATSTRSACPRPSRPRCRSSRRSSGQRPSARRRTCRSGRWSPSAGRSARRGI